jgi:6-pyruvoyltetrahydropterin/6-carboxytetrahydropterin synthase
MIDWCEISKEIEFDAGHRVPSHQGKCKNPHGHRYKIQVKCIGKIVDNPGHPEHGMLVDFSDLKHLMTEHVHDVLDHGFIVWTDDKALLSALSGYGWNVIEFPYIPTAENLARWSWSQLEPLISGRFGDSLLLKEVAIWETPTSVAYYSEPY